MDRLGEEILGVYQEAGLNAEYIESKRNNLEGKNRLECFKHIYSLDTGNMSRLAAKLGVSPHALEVTLAVMQKVL